MTIISETRSFSNNLLSLNEAVTDLNNYIQQAASKGEAIHRVEKYIFDAVIKLGQQALGAFIGSQGDGDVGETLILKNGDEVKRSKETYQRYYRSIFGSYLLERYVYWKREHQAIECVPLDTRLQLPISEYSHVLQDWCQMLTLEVPFEKSKTFLERLLPIHLSVDSLEHINRMQAQYVSDFREHQRLRPPEKESKILVTSADAKGVPIRHEKDCAQIMDHQKKHGPKPDRKKMAVVAVVYTVDPHVRTPKQVLEALFKEPGLPEPANKPVEKRPVPANKEVIANLTRPIDGKEKKATEMSFEWIKEEVSARDPDNKKEHVALMDGQLSLWEQQRKIFPDKNYSEILDLLHATGYLWDAAALFHSGNQSRQEFFMRENVLKMLNGKIKKIIKNFRKASIKQKFSKQKQAQLETVCNYFINNQDRMKYHQYLAKGYPIASGVIEGACRHFVKDRMERAGMRWTIEGAQSMLDIRSTFLNGDWDEFTKYRIKKETKTLYSQRSIIAAIEWPVAA